MSGIRNVQVYDCRTCRGRGRLHRNLCPDCNGRRVVVIQNGGLVHLTSTPKALRGTQGDTRSGPTTYEQRKADVLCTTCGSPNLASENQCQTCLDAHNDKYNQGINEREDAK